MSAERLTVGLVRGLHGLRGAIRVEVLSDDASRFSEGATVYLDESDRPLTIAWVQHSKPGVLLRFDELPSREAVEPLRGHYLEALVADPLPEGRWYWHQIEGLEVSSTTGEAIGKVVEVMRIGEAEVYVVSGGVRGEILVPAVAAMIAEFEPDLGRMIIDLEALGEPLEPPSPRPPRPPRPPRQVRVTRRMRQRAAKAAATDSEPATHQADAKDAGADEPG
jgi:16S rRNA processing protein RimM